LVQLTKEEVVTIRVLKQQRQSHCLTARTLGVSEGTVRYHLRRAAAGAVDGRKKQMLVERAGLVTTVKE
jgi:hypothetical protein